VWPAALAVGGVVWFAIAGVGFGYLLEPGLRPFVRKSLRGIKVADGVRRPDPTDEETATWTRRWSRIGGFVALFAGAAVIGSLTVEEELRRVLLAAYGGALPLLGYGVRVRPRRALTTDR
jgi:hypothetical protein